MVTDPLHCVRTVASFGRVGLLAVAEPVYSSPMWRKKWSRKGSSSGKVGLWSGTG